MRNTANAANVLQETSRLEAEIFEQRQRVAMASELKSVLDSWVRYEQQAKEAEQAQLAKSVIEKVLKSLSDEKAQKDILLSAVSEVERTSGRLHPKFSLSNGPRVSRTRQGQGYLIFRDRLLGVFMYAHVAMELPFFPLENLSVPNVGLATRSAQAGRRAMTVAVGEQAGLTFETRLLPPFPLCIIKACFQDGWRPYKAREQASGYIQ